MLLDIKLRVASLGIEAGFGLDDRSLVLFSAVSKMALGPTQRTVEYRVFFTWREGGRVLNLTAQLHLMPRSIRIQGQLC
jgi:hypothetical protein